MFGRLNLIVVAPLGAVLLYNSVVYAETAEQAPAPKCKTAEINPVTGHVFCIDPVGAAVEAPPSDIAPDCKADESRGQWTWAPTCKDRPDG
jgi:hypothetical protein